jgi:hypothetical protein
MGIPFMSITRPEMLAFLGTRVGVGNIVTVERLSKEQPDRKNVRLSSGRRAK